MLETDQKTDGKTDRNVIYTTINDGKNVRKI